MREKAIQYARIYKIPIWCVDIMVYLPETYWYLFQVGSKTPSTVTISPGSYTYVGKKPKKLSLQSDVILATQRAQIKEIGYKCFNISKRGGVLGERLTLTFNS